MSTWRDAPTGDLPDPTPLSVALDREVRRLGGPATAVTTAIFGRWADLVGAEVAAHASPRSLRGGVLVVVADSPVWATELRFLAGELTARIRSVTNADAVAEVQVRVAGEGHLPRR